MKKKSIIQWMIVSILVVTAAIVFFIEFADNKGNKATAAIDVSTLVDVKGEAIDAEVYEGKTIMLNFWATYCPPCKEEMPVLNEVYNQYKSEKFELVAVNVDEPIKIVNSFLASEKVTFPVAIDQSGKLSETFSILELPTTVIIDSKGKVIERIEGEMTEEEITTIIKSASK